GKDIASVERDRGPPARRPLGSQPAASAAVEGGGELAEVGGEGAGAQADRRAVGDEEGIGGADRVELPAQPADEHAEVIPRHLEVLGRPEEVEKEVAGVGALAKAGEVGEQQARLLQGKARDRGVAFGSAGGAELHPQPTQEFDPPGALHRTGCFAALVRVPYGTASDRAQRGLEDQLKVTHGAGSWRWPVRPWRRKRRHSAGQQRG